MLFTYTPPKYKSHSWEQRKLSELYEKASRKNDLTYGKYDIISVANMYFKPDSYITDERYLLTYNIFELGDIAFEGNKSKNYAHGRFVENTIGNGIVSHVFDVFKPIMKPYDLQFWKYAINNERLMGGILLRSTKASTMMTNLVANDFLQETFLVPSYPEQQKIGAFFQGLDNLITLHQRNSADFVSRFLSDFTNTWEQRKLGELVDVCSGRDYKHLSEGTIPVYGTGGYMLSVNDALSYDRDAIGIGRKGTIDRPYILKAPFWTVDTLFYAIPREKVDLNYAFDIFQNIDWKKKDESTGVPSLSKTAINDIDVLAPKHDEQQIIGQFFAAIDNLITLHQRECFFVNLSLITNALPNQHLYSQVLE